MQYKNGLFILNTNGLYFICFLFLLLFFSNISLIVTDMKYWSSSGRGLTSILQNSRLQFKMKCTILPIEGK